MTIKTTQLVTLATKAAEAFDEFDEASQQLNSSFGVPYQATKDNLLRDITLADTEGLDLSVFAGADSRFKFPQFNTNIVVRIHKKPAQHNKLEKLADKVNIEIDVVDYKGKDVVVVKIPNSEFKPHKLIIIDDNSTDNTKKIINEYKKKYKILLIENKDGPRWQSICWNDGLYLSSGNYLGFLDADDYLYPNALEEMSKYYIKNENIVCAWSQNERWDKDFKYKIANGFSEEPYSKGSLIDSMLQNPGVVVSHFLTCKKETLLQINGFDISMKTSADKWLALKMDLLGNIGFLKGT
jgi:hypothetical protein